MAGALDSDCSKERTKGASGSRFAAICNPESTRANARKARIFLMLKWKPPPLTEAASAKKSAFPARNRQAKQGPESARQGALDLYLPPDVDRRPRRSKDLLLPSPASPSANRSGFQVHHGAKLS